MWFRFFSSDWSSQWTDFLWGTVRKKSASIAKQVSQNQTVCSWSSGQLTALGIMDTSKRTQTRHSRRTADARRTVDRISSSCLTNRWLRRRSPQNTQRKDGKSLQRRGDCLKPITTPRVEWNSLRMIDRYHVTISILSASFTGVYVIYRPTRRIFLPVFSITPPVTRLLVCKWF